MAELVPQNIVDRMFIALRGSAPCNVHAEWFVGGPVDTARLAEAAAATVREHPLLRARQGPDGVWVVPDGATPPPVGEMTAVGEPAVEHLRGRLVGAPFDLRRDPPVRFDVVRARDGDHVVVVADHALVDGVGIGRTVISLMSHYTRGGRSTVDRTWRAAHRLAAPPAPAQRAEAILRELSRRATPTAVRLAREHEREEPGYGVAYRDLSGAARFALMAAPRGPASANDRVVAAFCLAGMQWNRSLGRPAVPFSVGVPINLRPPRTWFEGVCNATLTWPVRVEDEDPAGVLAQVSDQLRPVRAGLYSPAVRALLATMAQRRDLTVRERHALATTTLVSTVPGADVARAHLPPGVASARLYGGSLAFPTMPMTFAVAPDASAHRISARYLLSHHSAEGAARFLSMVDFAVLRLCEPRGPRAQAQP
ncbi:MAG TPA: hypothetical protein VH479_06020 [Acidimicrobiales bacterium]